MAKARTPRKRSSNGDTPEQRLIDAALKLAESEGWRRTGLAAIAAEAGMPLHEAYALHRSKQAILHAFQRRIDATVLAEIEADPADTARERLFDTLMRRFDALKPHRAAIRSILRDSLGDPAALFGIAALKRSLTWMLEASGIAVTGCRGRLLVNLNLALYLSVLRVFLTDESEDLAKTMAALDRGLSRGEQLCRLARGHPQSRPAASA
jgi:AcrR family transcriptional regulator